MKICIVGCGNQGGCLAALLAMEPETTEIVLADMDTKKAETVRRLIIELGGKAAETAITVTSVNAKNEKDVARVAAGAKLVFNGILPFCNVSVMKGCLLAGANYMDLYALSSDVQGTPYEQTIEAQLALDEQFHNAGLVALPSEGVAPGWINLITAKITDDMDEVDDIIIRSITWLEGKDLLAMGPPEMSIEMSLRLEPSSYYENGKIVELPTLDHGEEYVFPEPAGKQRIYLESVSCVESMIRKRTKTVPRRILHRGAILGGTDVKDLIFRAVREQVLKHPGTVELNLVKALAASLKPMANSNFKQQLEDGSITNGADTAVVEVTGRKNGCRVRHIATFTSTVHEAVKHIPWVGSGAYGTVGSMPLVLSGMILRDELKLTGVVLADQLSESDMILRKIESYGHVLTETREISTCI